MAPEKRKYTDWPESHKGLLGLLLFSSSLSLLLVCERVLIFRFQGFHVTACGFSLFIFFSPSYIHSYFCLLSSHHLLPKLQLQRCVLSVEYEKTGGYHENNLVINAPSPYSIYTFCGTSWLSCGRRGGLKGRVGTARLLLVVLDACTLLSSQGGACCCGHHHLSLKRISPYIRLVFLLLVQDHPNL